MGAAVGKLRKGWAETTAKPTAGEDKGRRKINTAGIEKKECARKKNTEICIYLFFSRILSSQQRMPSIYLGDWQGTGG